MQITEATESVAEGAMNANLQFCRRQETSKPEMHFG
jgi:hypothetical protein